jgi:hypothetical protein
VGNFTYAEHAAKKRELSEIECEGKINKSPSKTIRMALKMM